MLKTYGISVQFILRRFDFRKHPLLLLDPNGFNFPQDKNTNLQIVEKTQIKYLCENLDDTGNFSFVIMPENGKPFITDSELGKLLYFMAFGKLSDNRILDKVEMLYATHDNGRPSIFYSKNVERLQMIVSDFIQDKFGNLYDEMIASLDKGVYLKGKKLVY